MALTDHRGFVHVIDDNATFRKTIEGRLKEFGYEVSTYPSAQHLLDRLPGENVPSCILLDVRLPGMSGPELQERLSELGSTLPIIFLTCHPDIPTTVHHSAALNLKYARDVVLSHVATLTPRERQVFELVIRGKSNKAIGNALGTAERTIKAHRHRVMEKLQVRSLPELVSLAERAGVLRDPPGS